MQEELYGTGIDEYQDETGKLVAGVGNDLKRQEEYYRKKLYDLETRIGNMILQNIVNGRKDMGDSKETNILKDKRLSDALKQNDSDERFDEKNRNSKYKISSRKKIFRRRTNILKQGVVRELSKDVQQIYYASLNNKRVIAEVTRNAQQQIYKNKSKEYY